MLLDYICPVCKTGRHKAIIPYSVLCKCLTCGIVYNAQYRTLSYNNNYFLDDYAYQYGKTYEEDFGNIMRLADSRIQRILTLWKKHYRTTPASLLDIGSALGFFLKAAKYRGFTHLEGIEVSQYAASFSRQHYTFPIINLPFEKAAISRTFDVITAWFFLEHCRYPLETLKRIADLANDQAICALSLPSFRGPMYMFHRQEWHDTHPRDHRVDFSPSIIRKMLKDAGFRYVKVVAAGIHPERVVAKTSIFHGIFSVFYEIFTKIYPFSDTIEVYAVK
jgi:2-polyprenyl-3-methyl-5-hydroxy-6-metoxy-1,4-benzoquinol methylase